MTQTPLHLSPRQEQDRHATELTRAALVQFDRLHDLHNCPRNSTVECGQPLVLCGEGRVPEPTPRCNGCGWQDRLLPLVMQSQGLHYAAAVDWLEQRLPDVSDVNDLPIDGGHRFRWVDDDGSHGYDLPELTRRVRNAWTTATEVMPGDDLPEGVTEVAGRILTIAEWESVCDLLDVLPTLYAQRDGVS